jgi:hypothetical protein
VDPAPVWVVLVAGSALAEAATARGAPAQDRVGAWERARVAPIGLPTYR